MVEIGQLWLPILLSTAAVFVVSALAWMVVGHHNKDVRTLENEATFIEQLKQLNIPPGTYMWPGCGSGEDMKSEAFQARYDAGPWGSINVVAAKPDFARNLVLTAGVYIVVSLFVAYLTGQSRAAGAGFMAVFPVASAAAILGYCTGSLSHAIFFAKPGRFVLTDLIDGLIYGLLTGLVFGVLWPAA